MKGKERIQGCQVFKETIMFTSEEGGKGRGQVFQVSLANGCCRGQHQLFEDLKGV